MSILEDLELLDLPDDLPYMTDFDLDDILFEFSTPGLFTVPESPKPAAEEPAAQDEPTVEIYGESPFEEILPEEEDEPMLENCGGIQPEVLHPEEAPAQSMEEDTILFNAEDDSFGDPIGDILFDFGTPTDDEGVKVYTPASKAQPIEEEDVKVYTPVKEEPEQALPSDETIPFAALQAEDFSEAAEVYEEPKAPVQPAPKAPGLFAKAAGLLMGLFGKKKAPAPAVQEQPVEAPVTEEDPFSVSLFEGWLSEEADDVVPAEEPAEVKAADAYDDAWQFSFFDEEEQEAVAEAEEPAEEPFTDELFAEVEALFAEDETDAAEEALTEEETEVAAEAAPVAEEADGYSIAEIMAELSDIPLEEIEEAFTVKEEVLPEAPAAEEAPAEEPDAIDVMMAELIGAAMETLRSEEASEEAAEELLPELAEDEDFAATEIFSVEEIVAELSDDVPSFDLGDTITFGAVSDVPAPETAPAPVQAEKGPGLLTKAAGIVMGLLAGLKKKPAPAPVQKPAAKEEDSYDYVAALFSSEDDASQSDLMLELELLAEMEAEKEASQAAWEAEERIVSIPEPEQEVPEAIALLQQEADDAAELARLEAEREAAELAALEAAKEEAMTAQAEEELFAWIESTNKIRGKAIAKEELPAFDREEEEEIPTYTTHIELPEDEPAEAVSAPVLTEEAMQPTMELTDEESSEEILSLLENPDTEQNTAAETEEEAAARRAKADEELRYVPDESPAKAIGSHIGKRFGAAFAAFTNSADAQDDDEEALGPEVTSTKAYKYFNQFVNGYRFRLRLSAVLCVIMGWIALGLPVFGSLKNPAVSAAMCLMILLTVMLAGVDILVSGVRALVNKRPGIHSLVTISCLASVIDAAVIIITKGAAGYLPFCAVSAVSMCFAIYGSLLYCRSQRLNFKTLEQCHEPLTISVDYGIVDEETTTVYRTIGAPENYIHRSEEEDLSETVYGIITPMLLAGIPVLALIAALASGHFGDFFHILAAMFAASASFSALVAFPLPYFLTQRDLYSTKAAIAGWAGTKEIGKVSSMVVTDRDLFPDETVSIKSVRIVDEVNPELTLSYFCSMIKKSGSCLVPAFDQLAENNDCQIREVENFQCHEAGGLSGNIGPDEVLIASHSYMKLRGFRIPARKKDSENALFMAANGHVIAYIVVEYKPIKSVRAGLESALRGSVEMVFAARDFNITPMLIAKKFKSPTDTLRFPSYNQRFEITDHSGSETAVCAAVVSRKSFFSYAAVVEKARYLYRSVTWAVALSAVSTVLGVLLMFIMALTGAGLTVGRLLIFMLLWLVPTLALTISISK